ncbi:TetR/AcrR family transcriptional regulator [Persicitalea jodogahamensis]|uniref:TetR family transcriptional regulator n=1 Tax=Persicitalea jodogahamensis TaxID=402147 RepID=A0A8J3G8L9_9BACT|nr:TetR/AcrR family transcriptional regulator [Persicitalea jodogahamensis]GHB59897.1 TetR family transcriptional regulator [Persicitalea jodogahamensis]
MAEEKQDAEIKIKEAARRVFLAQGYEGTKMRQIAEAAGVNLAMINYYFRSKEQLFNSIYAETFSQFIGQVVQLINESTPLEVKVWKIVDRYCDFLVENPLVPGFILSKQRVDGGEFFKKLDVRGVIENSVFKKQLAEETEKGNIRSTDPLQVITVILGSLVFPIMAQQVVSYVGGLDNKGFREFMEERKQIIPEMIMAYLKVK